MALPIYPAHKALGASARNDVVHHLSLRQYFLCEVTLVAPTTVDVVASGWQMDKNRHHLEATLVILGLAHTVAIDNKGDKQDDENKTSRAKNNNECGDGIHLVLRCANFAPIAFVDIVALQSTDLLLALVGVILGVLNDLLELDNPVFFN